MGPLAEWTSHGMMLAGIALLVAILLRRVYRYQGRVRRGEDHSPLAGRAPLPTRASSRGLSDAPQNVLRWEVEMHELARDLKAELDTKMRLLQVLISQAQGTCERLQRLLAQADGLPPGQDAPERPVHPRLRPSTARSPRESAIYALAEAGHTAREIADQLAAPLGEVELLLSLRSPPRTP
jgi:hypothetical protein